MEIQGTQTGQPSVGSGTAKLFYVVALFMPIIGTILWLTYKGKPSAADRAMAGNIGFAAVVGFVLNLVVLYG
jgi:hypothetical protein